MAVSVQKMKKFMEDMSETNRRLEQVRFTRLKLTLMINYISTYGKEDTDYRSTSKFVLFSPFFKFIQYLRSLRQFTSSRIIMNKL